MRPVRELGERLIEIPGVVAVALGGSRAGGLVHPDSDWDFGLYYRDATEPRTCGRSALRAPWSSRGSGGGS
jgi:predicted nucleotidyltransferase